MSKDRGETHKRAEKQARLGKGGFEEVDDRRQHDRGLFGSEQ